MRYVILLLLIANTAAAQLLSVPAGLDAFLPVPETNPLTKEKIELGRKLFTNTRLSRDRSIACVTCHDPKLAFTDSRKVSVGTGVRAGQSRVPSLINRAY